MSADQASSSQPVRVIRHTSRYFLPSRLLINELNFKFFCLSSAFCRLYTSVKEHILTTSVKGEKYNLLTSLTPTMRLFFSFFTAPVVDILRRRSHACQPKKCQLGLRGPPTTSTLRVLYSSSRRQPVGFCPVLQGGYSVYQFIFSELIVY